MLSDGYAVAPIQARHHSMLGGPYGGFESTRLPPPGAVYLRKSASAVEPTHIAKDTAD